MGIGFARCVCNTKATPAIDRRIHNKLTKKVYNMKIKVIDNARDIREAFIKRFVMSWEEFQVKQKDWIADRKKTAIQSNALGMSNLTCGTK